MKRALIVHVDNVLKAICIERECEQRVGWLVDFIAKKDLAGIRSIGQHHIRAKVAQEVLARHLERTRILFRAVDDVEIKIH